mmetsp:Transcript_40800/g.89550  ORF Transcript_40800/g.89550 Transcript_40800/m.89550 type:complete len:270 (-) Transcript_40800:525-1334(-)
MCFMCLGEASPAGSVDITESTKLRAVSEGCSSGLPCAAEVCELALSASVMRCRAAARTEGPRDRDFGYGLGGGTARRTSRYIFSSSPSKTPPSDLYMTTSGVAQLILRLAEPTDDDSETALELRLRLRFEMLGARGNGCREHGASLALFTHAWVSTDFCWLLDAIFSQSMITESAGAASKFGTEAFATAFVMAAAPGLTSVRASRSGLQHVRNLISRLYRRKRCARTIRATTSELNKAASSMELSPGAAADMENWSRAGILEKDCCSCC